jgi:hypothetical protein
MQVRVGESLTLSVSESLDTCKEIDSTNSSEETERKKGEENSFDQMTQPVQDLLRHDSIHVLE